MGWTIVELHVKTYCQGGDEFDYLFLLLRPGQFSSWYLEEWNWRSPFVWVCFMCHSASCLRGRQWVEDRMQQKLPSFCHIHLVFWRRQCHRRSSDICVAWGVLWMILGGHTGAVHWRFHCWCWIVFWWWLSMVRVRRILSGASGNWVKVGFARIDELHTVMGRVAKRLRGCVLACQSELAGGHIVDWRR